MKKYLQVQYSLLHGMIIGLLCMIVSFIFMGINYDFSHPLTYSMDALTVIAAFKRVVQEGWFFQDKMLGSPMMATYYDYLTFDFFHFFIVKIMSLFTQNPILIFNAYNLFGYGLISFISFIIFRKLGVSIRSAILGTIVFTFLPFHQFRIKEHTFLSFYFQVPFILYILHMVYSIRDGAIHRRKIVSLFLLSALIGLSGIYYAFYSCFFLSLAAAIFFINKADHRSLKIKYCIFSILTVIFFILVQAIPYKINNARNGRNSHGLERKSADSDMYSLNIIQLVLPVTNHQIDTLKEIKKNYQTQAFFVNENDGSTLGFICLFGFIFFWFLLLRGELSSDKSFLSFICIMTIFAVFFGTFGGGGTIFSYLIVPYIRSNNRISVYIALFSLFAVMRLLDSLNSKLKISSSLKNILAFSLILFALMDQIPEGSFQDMEKIKATYSSEKTYFEELEKRGAKKIFFLPYIQYPEPSKLLNGFPIPSYEYLKGYIHTKQVQWAYGGMKYREADVWNLLQVRQPLREFLKNQLWDGYSGILLYLPATMMAFPKLDEELEKILKVRPIYDSTKFYAYFPLDSLNTIQIGGKSSEEEKKKFLLKKDEFFRNFRLHPEDSIEMVLSPEFSSLPQPAGDDEKAFLSKASIKWNNKTSSQRLAEISFTLHVMAGSIADCSLVSGIYGEQLTVLNQVYTVDQFGLLMVTYLNLHPGENVLNFNCVDKAGAEQVPVKFSNYSITSYN